MSGQTPGKTTQKSERLNTQPKPDTKPKPEEKNAI